MPDLPYIVTYSPAYTLVPTYECFNRCSYCNFRVNPHGDDWMTLEQANSTLTRLQGQGVSEILILSGEVHPESDRRTPWFRHIYNLCDLALSYGFLPHANVGPLSMAEMAQLKSVNASMGLMVEQVTSRLMETVHRHAPSKKPEERLRQLDWAGQLRIPFTTGLLVGIGETEENWQETLGAIAQSHQRWGHIQEVILQPHRPGSRQKFPGVPFQANQMPALVRLARHVLPNDIAIQIPPNLVQQPDILRECIRAGASDLGGIVPKDEVNPDYPHLEIEHLMNVLATDDIKLVPRLPVYRQYEHWLPDRLQHAVAEWRHQRDQKALLELR